jgi:hypothetical protein
LSFFGFLGWGTPTGFAHDDSPPSGNCLLMVSVYAASLATSSRFTQKYKKLACVAGTGKLRFYLQQQAEVAHDWEIAR